MFEHLLDPQFDDIDGLDSTDTLAAQAGTTAWLKEIGASPSNISIAHKELARKAFTAVTDVGVDDEGKKKAVLALKVPQAVQHLAGMLSQYDWDYVKQAKEIRGKVVAGLLEETSHPDARIRLKSLELLGKLTEVGSFTERIEIKKVDASDAELQERIRSKLANLLPKTLEVQDVAPKDA